MTTDCKPDKRSKQIHEEYRFSFMLISIIGLMMLEPFVYDFVKIKFLITLFITGIILSSIYAVSYRKYDTIIAVFLALPLVIISWSSPFVDFTWQKYVEDFFGILFFLFIILKILSYIFRQDVVTREILFASIVVYLLLGLMWSFIFQFVETFHPGAFVFPQGQQSEIRSGFLYYSFVTLTTLGYGDITPVTPPARSISIVEAITGQMYVCVLIARLMGMHIAQSMQKKPR